LTSSPPAPKNIQKHDKIIKKQPNRMQNRHETFFHAQNCNFDQIFQFSLLTHDLAKPSYDHAKPSLDFSQKNIIFAMIFYIFYLCDLLHGKRDHPDRLMRSSFSATAEKVDWHFA